MKRNKANKSILKHYFFTYFSAILFVAGIVSAVLVTISALQLQASKRETILNNLTLVAEEMESEYTVLQTINNKITLASCYRPNILALDKYRDIELLEDFVNYKYYSPICNKYFLLYRDSVNIYTSDGNTSNFLAYTAENFGLSQEKGKALYDLINTTDRFAIMEPSPDSDWILFVYSVNFFGNENVYTAAATVFVVSKSALFNRLNEISGYIPENYAIYYGDQLLLSGPESSELSSREAAVQFTSQQFSEKLQQNNYLFAAESEKGLFSIISEENLNIISELGHQYYLLIILFVLVATLLFLVLSYLLAYYNFLPIQNLTRKINPAANKGKRNELLQIEDFIHKLEAENNFSLQNLKEQILIMILNGNYSSEILDKWPIVTISESYSHNCVIVLECKRSAAEFYPFLQSSIEDFIDEDLNLYSVLIPHKNMIALIVNYRYGYQYEEIIDYLTNIGIKSEQAIRLFSGKVYETPYKLSISYQEALESLSCDRFYDGKDVSGNLVQDAKNMTLGILNAVQNKDYIHFNNILQNLRDYVINYAPSLLLQKYLCYTILSEFDRFCEKNGITVNKENISSLLMVQSFDVFIHDIREIILKNFDVPEMEENEQAALTKKIMDFLQTNACDSDFNLDVFSEQFHFSTDYMGKMIKKLTGHTFKEHITLLRIQKAKELLLACPDITVKDVALQSGYRKPSNFIKKFKEITGLTPLQYRQM